MIRNFRKHHRTIAIISCLPLLLTTITGIGYTVFDKWFGQEKIAGFLMKIHTFSILGLEDIYPLLNGLALVGLLVTGLSMTGLFKNSLRT
jgi:hypothetical protein